MMVSTRQVLHLLNKDYIIHFLKMHSCKNVKVIMRHVMSHSLFYILCMHSPLLPCQSYLPFNQSLSAAV